MNIQQNSPPPEAIYVNGIKYTRQSSCPPDRSDRDIEDENAFIKWQASKYTIAATKQDAERDGWDAGIAWLREKAYLAFFLPDANAKLREILKP